MRFLNAAASFLLSVVLIGCGGGGVDPIDRPQNLSAAADPFGGVDKVSATNQLLDFGEKSFPQYFPAQSVTGTYQQYLYRFYPATGIYLGVDQNSGGVYVMGGSFGSAPAWVGMLTSFITPLPPPASAWQFERSPSSSWQNVRYINGRFYAMEGDAFVSSPDGVQWSAVLLPALPTVTSNGIAPMDMAYGDHGFVAVNGDGVPLYSADGASWSIGTVTKASDASGLDPKYLSIWTVAAGNGVYVASGAQGVMTSIDGVHWESRLGPANGGRTFNVYQIAFGNGRFVAAGYGGNYYSTDGIQWTAIADPAVSAGVAFGNGVFVATDGATTMVSTDGATWTAGGDVSNTSTGTFSTRMSFGSGRFYVYGYKGVDVSTDGIHWSVLYTHDDSSWPLMGVASNGADTVLVGWNGLVLHSSDDAHWTNTLPTEAWSAAGPVDCMNGTCVAVAPIAGVLVSTDSLHWSEVALPYNPDLALVAHGNGVFVVVGNNAAYSSSDGTHWTVASLGVATTPSALVFAGGRFLAISGNTAFTSTDAVHWTSGPSGLPAIFLGRMAFGNGHFAILDRQGHVYSSTNGSEWTQGAPGTWADAIAFGGAAGFVAVGSQGAIWHSADGTAWTRSSSGTSVDLYGVTYGGGQYMAVGDGGTVLVSEDAVNWTLRNTGQPAYLRGVTFDGQSFIAVGGGIAVSTH